MNKYKIKNRTIKYLTVVYLLAVEAIGFLGHC